MRGTPTVQTLHIYSPTLRLFSSKWQSTCILTVYSLKSIIQMPKYPSFTFFKMQAV